MSLPPVLYKGSVKDVRGDSKGEGHYYFDYSDRYSMFDWGAMPDLLENKGRSLAFMAHHLFERLEKKETWSSWDLPLGLPSDLRSELQESSVLKELRQLGAAHHSLGLVHENLRPVEPGEVSSFLKVGAVKVLRPLEGKKEGRVIWNYEAYQKGPTGHLVPLEVIFRFGVPKGSSLLGRTSDPEYVKELGLKKVPVEGEWLERPVVEFSTKLEPQDRMLSYE